jgi:2-polyprenyl-3-methyl-5-hydroxy-6-metoxy-1,4-benzoquinol methylase
MDDSVEQRLGELNRNFYRQFAESFADTRSEPQPGFYELETYIPPSFKTMLDVGCGEGRLGRFLLSRGTVAAYDGIDGSAELIEIAGRHVDGRFWHRDLNDSDALRDLGQYQVVACLAVLQHIPGRDNRVRLLAEMGGHLSAEGRLFISTWQFLGSDRQRKKIIDWGEAGVEPDSVEEHDYLLTWRRGGLGLRYVSYIDEAEILALAEEAGLQCLATFRADGREGDLNLYSVFEAAKASHSDGVPEGQLT